MKLKLEISMDNAAFEDSGELARILTELAKKLACWDNSPKSMAVDIRDVNGNTVGKATLR